ncbi:MAG TPA: NADH-quinone oxidoreductase subunit L [Coriobacteriia bacterium]
MSVLHEMPYLAVLVPLALAVVLAAGVRFWGNAAAWIALLGPLTGLAVGIASIGGGTAGTFTWIRVGQTVLRLGYDANALTVVMLLVVGVVASCVMVFSIGYMHGEKGYVRYYALLSLFTAAMAALVLAADLVSLFVGWELVGACSFLLIGFWYAKPSAAEAARKAFMVTRIGDAAMLLGMAVLWNATGTLELSAVLGKAATLAPGVATAAAICVLLGAVGKSAQFPLHIWLPDAMEGPTPVSALIHAATMVAAGVFLIARVWPLFEVAPAARGLALTLGTITALGAATVALAQRDIKKVLAWSTISQLGFMFAALGVGAWPVAIFHLVTHAAFKALLFLSAGSVIHGSGTQDLAEMGGLAKKMPLTAACWIAGVVSLAGIPPAAGFFSKDEVVASVLHAAPWAGVALFAASALTAAYAARATRLAFFGEPRGAKPAHESPWTMIAPLALLAVGALGLGFAGAPLAALLGHEAEPLSVPIAATAVSLALVGAFLGWRSARPEASADPRFAALTRAAYSGWGVDAFADRFVVRPATALARMADAMGDRLAIDGLAEGVATMASRVGGLLAEIQSGDGQWYAALMATGVVVLAAAAVWLVR